MCGSGKEGPWQHHETSAAAPPTSACSKPHATCDRIEELQRKETAANAEVSRLKEELAEAGERLIAETADKDAVAGELQALRDSNAAMEKDWKSGKRPVRTMQP